MTTLTDIPLSFRPVLDRFLLVQVETIARYFHAVSMFYAEGTRELLRPRPVIGNRLRPPPSQRWFRLVRMNALRFVAQGEAFRTISKEHGIDGDSMLSLSPQGSMVLVLADVITGQSCSPKQAKLWSAGKPVPTVETVMAELRKLIR
jgi:hypothetical protein